MLFVVGAFVSMLYMRNTTTSLRSIIRLSQIEHLRQDLIMNIQTVQSNLYTARTPLAEDLDFVVKNVSALDAAANRCNACHHSPQIASRISEVQYLVEDYKTALSDYITASADLKKTEKLKKEAAVIGSRLIGLTQKMTFEANEHLEQKTKVALSEVDRTKIFLMVTIALTALIAVLISLYLINAVVHPVSELVNATRAVASGNFNYKIAYQDKTEFGELAKSFNSMTSALQDSYESIKDQQQKIKEDEWKFRTLSEFAYDWELWITEKGEILFISSSCERITGYTRDEFIKDPDIRSRIVYSQDKDLWKRHLSGFKSPRHEEIEFRIVTKSGEIKWLSHLCAPIYENDVFLGRRVSNRDITDRKALEEQLMHSQRLESIGTLAGGIAHDFNNILTAITGYGYILKMKAKEGDPAKTYIEQILASADRAADLTQSLLAFSRKQISAPEPVKLKAVIENAKRIIQRVIGENIELRTEISGEELTAMADSAQMEQVLVNLCTNARDAMPEGGILAIKVKRVSGGKIRQALVTGIDAINIEQDKGYAEISVIDTGTGMDEKTREHIFEPFFTTKEVGKGTGLGLAMVYGIIKQHHGHISVESEEGKGTAFRIYLPLISDSGLRNSDLKSEIQNLKSGMGETILLAEDEEAVRALSKTALEEFGYKVIEASDGQEAVSKFMENKDRIDLFLTDIVMPGMNGREAYERIKKIKPRLKVLFASGYPSDFTHKSEILAEGLDFIGKPVSPDNLLKKVREVLDTPK